MNFVYIGDTMGLIIQLENEAFQYQITREQWVITPKYKEYQLAKQVSKSDKNVYEMVQKNKQYLLYQENKKSLAKVIKDNLEELSCIPFISDQLSETLTEETLKKIGKLLIKYSGNERAGEDSWR